jgi:outer membrane lipopolysaccharide assembly protein LptE/RlpB
MMLRRILILVLLVCVLVSCGYHLPGQSEALPGGVKSVYLPLFMNHTNKPLLGNLMNSSLSTVLSRNSQLVLTKHETDAEAILSGDILTYGGRALSYTSSDDISKYRVTMKITAKLMRASDNELLWEKTVSRTEDYDGGDNDLSQDDYEEAARSELCTRLAEDIYYQLIDDF